MATKPKKAEPAKKGAMVLVDLTNALGKSCRADAREYQVLESTPDQLLIQNGDVKQWVSRHRTFEVQESL